MAIIQTGSMPNVLAALQSREIPAASLSPPQSFLALKQGYHELTNTYGTPYVAGAVSFPRQWTTQRTEVVERYVRACLEGIAVAKRDRTAVFEIMRKCMLLENDRILSRTYELHIQQLLPAVPRIPLAGVRVMMDELGETLPRAREARAEELFDNGFLDRLETSGFVAELYR